MKKLLLTLTLLGLTTAFANAATSFTATANIISDITLTESTPLSFGTVRPAGVGTTLVNANASLGTVTVLSGLGDLVNPGTVGVIGINGNDGATVNVAIVGDTNLVGPNSKTLAVTFQLDTDVVTLAAVGGVGSVKVGGTLTVLSNSTTGLYTGTYTINATYP